MNVTDDVEAAGPLPGDTPTLRETTERGQRTAQVLLFASELNRVQAARLQESTKVVLSAAVLGFAQLEPAVQLDLIRQAREKHALRMELAGN